MILNFSIASLGYLHVFSFSRYVTQHEIILYIMCISISDVDTEEALVCVGANI